MPLIDLKPFEVAMTRQKAVGRGTEGQRRGQGGWKRRDGVVQGEEGWEAIRSGTREKHAGS